MTEFGITENFGELAKATLSEKKALTEETGNNVEMIDESAKSQDFFQKNKPSEMGCTMTRI